MAGNFCGTHDIRWEMPARMNVNILSFILVLIRNVLPIGLLISMPEILKWKKKLSLNEGLQKKNLNCTWVT